MCPNSDRKLYEAYNSLLHLYHAQFQQLGVAARVVGGAVAAGVNNCDKWALQTDRTPSVPISLRLLWRIKSVATRLASKRASLSCVVNVACYSPTPLFARRRGKMPLNAPLQLQSSRKKNHDVWTAFEVIFPLFCFVSIIFFDVLGDDILGLIWRPMCHVLSLDNINITDCCIRLWLIALHK